eukprot:1149421-Prymnesium_polylepis.1
MLPRSVGGGGSVTARCHHVAQGLGQPHDSVDLVSRQQSERVRVACDGWSCRNDSVDGLNSAR